MNDPGAGPRPLRLLATAILDRPLHHCEPIAFNGPSYRLKNRLKAINTAAIPKEANAA